MAPVKAGQAVSLCLDVEKKKKKLIGGRLCNLSAVTDKEHQLPNKFSVFKYKIYTVLVSGIWSM